MTGEPRWKIIPPKPPSFGPPPPVPEVRALMRIWLDRLVQRGDYTQEEIAAQEDRARECSWAAEPARMYGPLSTVAMSAGKVIGGVELWENQRDRFWFLELLVRDQASEFKGVGADLVRAAVGWWIDKYSPYGLSLRVHSMAREAGAVQWWTKYIGRQPDFADAFIRNADYLFSAVGWIIYPGTSRARAGRPPG